MLNFQSKLKHLHLSHNNDRYAEIVNVQLGDGSTRKGQVLEINGKRAVVQVRRKMVLFIILFKV